MSNAEEQAAIARELIEKVKREAGIPRFMKATVMSVADSVQFGGQPLMNVKIDGDPVGRPTPAFNCLGLTPSVGKRVLVLFTPEGGVYAISTLDGTQAGEFPKSFCAEHTEQLLSGNNNTWTTTIDPNDFSSQTTAFVASLFLRIGALGAGTTPSVTATFQIDGINTSLSVEMYDSQSLGATGYTSLSHTCLVEVPTASFGAELVNGSTEELQFFVSIVLQETVGTPCCLKVGGG